MTRRAMLAGLLTLGAALAICGCQREGPRTAGSQLGDVRDWLKGATDPARVPAVDRRVNCAQTLAAYPPEKLQPLKEELKKAVAAEKNAEIKKWLKKALEKAG